jgi:NADH dehydrogenase
MKPKVLVIGGSGFVGKHITKRLSALNYISIVPTRHQKLINIIEKNSVSKAMIIQAISQANVDEVIKTLQPNDVVINLVGVLHAQNILPYGPEFQQAHIDIPIFVMNSMQKFGLKRYIHMSALGADKYGPSMYLRSKGVAEELVKNSGLDWTIFRPSVIFGPDDSFINMFGTLQKYFPVMPLSGAGNLFQPVAVQDVAQAFVAAIEMLTTIHQSYDVAGPEVLTLKQIIQFAAKKQGLSRPVIPLPKWAGYLQALLLEKVPGKTIMSRDNIASMKLPSILPQGQANALSEVFGVSPTPLDSLLK